MNALQNRSISPVSLKSPPPHQVSSADEKKWLWNGAEDIACPKIDTLTAQLRILSLVANLMISQFFLR